MSTNSSLTSEGISSSAALHPSTPKPNHLQLQCRIFTLPRELRDMIYDEYITVYGGYVYDADDNKLVQASDGGRIDVRLMRVCRRMNQEMEGLPMQKNKVTFRSYCTPESSHDAGVLHAAVNRILRTKWVKICMVGPSLLTEDVKHQVASEFPYFRPVLDGFAELLNYDDISEQPIFEDHYPISYGQPQSIFRDFVDLLFTLLSKHPDWATLTDAEVARASLVDADFVGSIPKSWSVLDREDAERIKKTFYPEEDWSRHYFTMPSEDYAFSATSLAIKWLGSNSFASRNLLRDIELVEAQAAVAFPESHARGLIPYCRENPKLRIRRHANLWKSVFPSASPDRSVPDSWRLVRGWITDEVTSWVVEATSLSALGMPANCFNLVLDGAPILAETTEIFKVVLEDSAYQAAMDVYFANDLLTDRRWLERRGGIEGWVPNYFEGLPKMIQDLRVDGNIVCCSFDLGPDIEIDKIIKERTGWTWDEWQAERLRRWWESMTHLPSVEFLLTNDKRGNWVSIVWRRDA
ncbi:hypothetical protein C7974DRAFT_383690 [Boeremia exigua]|uniref:uncharacterized protein n=1 Tax=Boeremia exigua TaxID=749465 RepID=UPI001E8E2CCF|nr:uncharacterized protein C7974DRAFT_383690 [Boeremia exigua]KAH6644509.1 hypothetical protein C7974DRAFT_383690 [Boeremia exigua]